MWLRDRLVIVALSGAFLAVLCLPGHRRMLLTQMDSAVWGQKPLWASGYFEGDPRRTALHRSRILAELERHPEDVRLHMGVAPRSSSNQVGEDLRLAYARRLCSRFPDDPRPLAQYLRYLCQDETQVPEPLLGSDASPTRAQPPQAAEVLELVAKLVKRGVELDPDNGFFPTMLALAQFGAGQDEEAGRSLHAASICTVWEDYTHEEGLGGRDLLILTFGDHGAWMHGHTLLAVVFPHTTATRVAARRIVAEAVRAGEAGDVQREHALRIDVIRLGGLMRRQGPYFIRRFAGASITEIGLTARTARVNRPQEPADRTRLTAAYLDRVEREAPQFAELVRREASEAEAIQDEFRNGPFMNVMAAMDRLSRAGMGREVAGLSLVANLFAGLAVWLMATLLGLLLQRFTWRPASTRRGWFWKDAPPWLRVAVLSLAPFALLGAVGVAQGVARPTGWLIPLAAMLALLLPALGGFDQPDAATSTRRAWAITGLVVLIVAVGTLPWPNGWKEPWAETGALIGVYWTGETTASWQGSPANQLLKNALPARIPIAGALLVAAALVALVKGASWSGFTQALRSGAKVLSLTLGSVYLAYLLYAVPTEMQAARTMDLLIQQQQTIGQ